MMNRTALIISTLLTALVLTIVGGVVYSVNNTQKAQAAAQAAQASQAAAAEPAVDAQLAQSLAQRETSYQQMIAEANNRLAEAQKNQEDLQAQVNALQSNVQPVAQSMIVSPKQAAQIAVQYLKQTKVYSVENSALGGKMAYKVTFSSGDLVYVGMTGEILGTHKAPRQSNPTTVLASHEGEHENEHEGDDD